MNRIPSARPRSTWRTVALPSEHGGWSLTLEPVLLGLLVAWSWPGLALGGAALLAFLARTPLKVVLVDRWRDRTLDRTRTAARVAAIELVLLLVLVGLAAVGAEPGFWVPLAIAAPLVALELWFDMRSRSRRLIPELAGTIGIGSVAASIALAGGEDASVAFGLWCVVMARVVAAIPFVRVQLLRAPGRPHRRWESDLAQILAVGIVTAGWLLGAVPFAAVVAIALLGVVDTVEVRNPPRRAAVIGVQQTVLGAAVVVATAVAVAAS